MLIEGTGLDDGSELRSEVAVVGAGPGGIVVALELARAGHDVLLVESGGPRYSAAVQRLGDTPHFDPRRHSPMSEATRRQIGGASAIWGGRCVPYDPVDFDDRPYVPHASWPLGYGDVQPLFQRACDWFRCGRAAFDIRDLPGVAQRTLVPGLPDGEVRSSTLERWSLPTNFGKEYSQELRTSARLRLACGLTCVEIECDPGGRRVAALRTRTLDGRSLLVRSRVYVVACGALETTRILLASDRVHPRGIGNHADKLGRFYMGHISGRISRVRFTTPPDRTVYGFDRDSDGVYVRRRLSFSREVLHRERLPNVAAWLVNPEIWDPAHGSGILSFAYLILTSPLGRHLASDAIRNALVGDRSGRGAWPHVVNMLRGGPATAAFIATFGWRRFVPWRKVPGFFVPNASNVYPLHYHGEQVPNPDSRVTLAEERDEVGLRKLRIDLRYSPQDVDGVLRAHRLWDDYLRRHGVGSLEYSTDDSEASVWEQAHDGVHQLGTTRMSARPEDGVVGPDGNVHGFEDLFVASSSTFVTSSQANSTFLIVALALRLADHLRAGLLRQ